MAHILAVDDDRDILALIKTALERENHRVETVNSVSDITLVKAQFADLILLDVMMPGEDGFAYCKRIRNQVDCPIIFVTARTAENDLLHGLGIGGDDYIIKPFSIAELRARVNAHLRRENRTHNNSLRVGDVFLNITTQTLLVENDPLTLTKSEYALCSCLMEHAGQVFSKEQLYETAFGYEGDSDYSVIVEHIKNIRAKLKAMGQDPIETVWGVGYRWKKESK